MAPVPRPDDFVLPLVSDESSKVESAAVADVWKVAITIEMYGKKVQGALFLVKPTKIIQQISCSCPATQASYPGHAGAAEPAGRLGNY